MTNIASPMVERHYVQGNKSDEEYRRGKSSCCGCHPHAHDRFVGCLVCGCQKNATTDQDAIERQPIYRAEAHRLLGCGGHTKTLERWMRRLHMRFRPFGLEREWAINVREFRQLRMAMGKKPRGWGG